MNNKHITALEEVTELTNMINETRLTTSLLYFLVDYKKDGLNYTIKMGNVYRVGMSNQEIFEEIQNRIGAEAVITCIVSLNRISCPFVYYEENRVEATLKANKAWDKNIISMQLILKHI